MIVSKLRFLVGAALLAAAMAPLAQADPHGNTRRANAVVVSTAPLALPLGHRARVALVQAFPGAPRLPVDVRFRDASGRVLGRTNGVVGGGESFIAAVDRDTAPTTEPVLVRAELVFGPLSDALPRSCPLHLTFQTVEGDVDDGPVVVCGVNICLDVAAGPPPRTGFFGNCLGAPTSLAQ